MITILFIGDVDRRWVRRTRTHRREAHVAGTQTGTRGGLHHRQRGKRGCRERHHAPSGTGTAARRSGCHHNGRPCLGPDGAGPVDGIRMQVQGRSFIQPPLENPFLISEAEAKRLREEKGVRVIFVDMHAETTSEKISTGYNLDGLVSAVVGTHTHVQTADETILEHVRPGCRGAGTGTGTYSPAFPHLHAGQIPRSELARAPLRSRRANR